MAYPKHLEAFVKLGTLFNEFCENDTIGDEKWITRLEQTLLQSEIKNKWYTRDNLLYAMAHWGALLTEENLTAWIKSYPIEENNPKKRVAVIMAGNIPMVGFHDFLCVLVTGHRVLVKLSSNDSVILPFIKKFLEHHDQGLVGKIAFTEEQLTDFDAVIATGSNNTSRYFEYYFGRYPNIIRKNRNSVAILSGNETEEQLENLGEDIFRYFGLGCRSVSKVFVPKGYDFDRFFNAIFKWKHLLDHHKYVNNYDYNKAVYLMSEIRILDNGFLILKEDNSLASPIATLFFEYYTTKEELQQQLRKEREHIQCVVSNGFMEHDVSFGETQIPLLSDYADGVDTMKFLLELV